VLVDFDPFIYACGFAAQKTDYSVIAELPDGEPRHAYFTTTPAAPGKEPIYAGDKMKEWIKSLPEGSTVLEKERVVIPEPLDFALHTVFVSLNSVHNHIKESPELGGRRVALRGFLSGPDNYRDIVSKRVVYKGNRDKTHRPFHYEEIKNYIKGWWDCAVSRNCEADDLIGIMAAQADIQSKDTCIVSIDKDLDQIPGWHYNPDKKVFYTQSHDDAILYFYEQCLSGDPTDNIPGCYKVGNVKARGIVTELSAYFPEQIGRKEEDALWSRVVEEYERSTEKKDCPYTRADASGIALETAQLVYIQKASRELWLPNGKRGIVPQYEQE
jgi:DNA polymerase-1